MLDFISYIMGFVGGIVKGETHVVLEDGTQYTFTDSNNDGNIVIQEADNNG